MQKKYIILLAVLMLFTLLLSVDADAQCAMCKATTESSLKEEASAGNGINKGILYIMFVPYTLLMLLVGIFFRDRIKGFLRGLGLFK